MKAKPRRFDLHPEEFLSAVSGEMSPAELGVYWMICLLCYTRGGTIQNDVSWLVAKFRPGKGNRVVTQALDRLIDSGRVVRDGSEIGVRRVRDEVEIVLRRIRDASESGKKGNKIRWDSDRVGDLGQIANHQLTTNNHKEESSNEDSKKNDTSYLKKKGSRLADDFVMPPEWVEDGRAARERAQLPPADLAVEILKFTNYWQTKTGQSAMKRDWRKTWLNWCLNAKGAPNGRDPTTPRIPDRGGPSAPLSEDQRRRVFNLDRK